MSVLKKYPLLWLWLLFGLAAIAITARNLLLPSDDAYTHYNNYIIFKQSFFHWWHGLNLYVSYPQEQYDLFKYSPAFAMAFGALAWLPDWLGLGIWNLLNAGVLVFAVSRLPQLATKTKLLLGILLLQETITSTINSQSNALIAGLLILAWIALEGGQWWKAACLISFTVFIKLFGILFFILFLFYPRWWKGILPSFVICSLLFFIPAVSGGWKTLMLQYSGYLDLLSHDHGTFVKYSVMGWLQSWFRIDPESNMVVLGGLGIQLAVSIYALIRHHGFQNRVLMAGSWMIWMVIFNHMAESATFIIAVTGVMLWFFYSGMNKWLKLAFLIPVMAFTCFGPSDIYPPDWREHIVITWQLKVFPCILIWMLSLWEIVKRSTSASATVPQTPS